MLLIGTASQIPYWSYAGAPHGDTPYGNMTGDERCEIAIGRMAPYSTSECQTMVAKTLAYERSPLLQDHTWYESATLVRNDDPYGNHWYNETYVFLNNWLPAWGYTNFEYLYDINGDDSTDVIAAIDADRMFVVYRGSSERIRWYPPFAFFPEVLASNWQLPIIVSGTCMTADFVDQNSMCNRWLRAGDAWNPKGCVAFLGATHAVADESLSLGRHLVTIGIFMGIFDYGYTVLGDAFLYGKSYMWDNFYPDCHGWENHGWTLMGDPTLDVWNETPLTMTVAHPAAIEMDKSTNITVVVTDQTSGLPIPDAWVTLYKQIGVVDDPEIYLKTQTNSNGQAAFNNVTVPTAGKLKVTATYHFWTDVYVPYQGEISVFEILSNDPNTLAYNGNRHMVRETGSDKLHITYTDNGHVFYRYSTDHGVNWSVREDVGTGTYPCIALGPLNAPAIAYTNSSGYLYFAKKSGGSWQATLLYQPGSGNDPLVNSPPAMVLNALQKPALVHILVTLTDQGAAPITHEVRHYYFNFDSPTGTYTTIDTAGAPITPLRRHSPTLVRNELDNSLHAAWIRLDTICYARKDIVGSWVRYGNPYGNDGLRSAYPFVESYGDSIYLVWQNKETPTSYEEVWRGRRHRNQVPIVWGWWNLSYTSSTISIYSENASGLYTVFMDESATYESFDIFMKVRPTDPLTNLSSTMVQSYYPQSVAKFTPTIKYLYTLYQEGISNPCEIKMSRWDSGLPKGEGDDIAYLSSFSGDSVISPYLTARDGFNPQWQIATDYGYQNLTYRFPLDPAYLYKAKVIAYHERTGQWKATCKIDGGNQMVIKYYPYEPETLTFWIPPNLYRDSVIEVSLSKITGNFVSMGQIYVYRYEPDSKGNSGPQSIDNKQNSENGLRLSILPNPVINDIAIAYTLPHEGNVTVTIYDAAGRVVTVIKKGVQMPGIHHESLQRLIIPQAIYFIRLTVDNETVTEKVVLVK